MFIADNNCKIVKVDLSDDTAVASGGGINNQILTPPAGKVYQIFYIGAYIQAPAGATANTHDLLIIPTNLAEPEGRLALLSGAFNSSIIINGQYGFASTTEYPSNIAEQYEIIVGSHIFVSNDETLTFKYTNDTDANQTATRDLYVLVKEFRESL